MHAMTSPSMAPEPRLLFLTSDKMPQCPHEASCRLFPLFSMSGTLAVWKTNYCRSDYTRCARYQRSLREEWVPDNLLPSGVLLKKVLK